jgi:hypothetical protein
MNRQGSVDPAAVFRDGEAIERAIIAARRRVILKHRQLGIPLVIWREGKVVEISPESVELPAIAP